MKDLVVLVPMLGRVRHIEPLLESLYATTSDFSTLFLVSPMDTDVKDKVQELGEQMLEIPYHPRGDYARKINAGCSATKSPLIFMGASDLKFHPGWLEAATSRISGDVQVVGTNDLGNVRVIRGLHSTHTLLTREYVARGTADDVRRVLHEGYDHEYVDDEFVETAKSRDAFAMALDSVVEHMHPAWGKGKWDRSYRGTNKRLQTGYRLYRRRRKLWT